MAADTKEPVTAASFSTPANGAGWHKANVTVTLTATDNAGGSGVKSLTYAASGATTIAKTTQASPTKAIAISAQGVTTLTFHAEDGDDNVEPEKTLLVRLDKTAPSTARVAVPPPNAAGWNKANVAVVLSATDTGGSGVASVVYQASPETTVPGSQAAFTITAEGTRTVTYHAVDVAGNAEADHSFVVKLDKTAPVLTRTAAQLTVNAETPTGATVTAYPLTLSDALDPSPVLSCLPSLPPRAFPIGTTGVTCNARDRAGNVTGDVSFSVFVKNAAQQLTDLRAAVLSAPGATGPILDMKLMFVLLYLGQGKPARACDKLDEFVEKVIDKRPPQTSAYLAAATRLKKVLRC